MVYPRDQFFLLKRGTSSFKGNITGRWVNLAGEWLIYIEDGEGGFAVGPERNVVPCKEITWTAPGKRW